MSDVTFALIAASIATPVLAQAPAQPTTNQPAVGIVAVPPAPTIRAIEDMLSPETRREIAQRATGGNIVYGVPETTLLNNLQVLDARGHGSRIIAIDFGREVMVASIANEAPRVFRSDRRTLAVRNP